MNIRRAAKIGRLLPLSRRRQCAGLIARRTHARAEVAILTPAGGAAVAAAAGTLAPDLEVWIRARPRIPGLALGEACRRRGEGRGEGSGVGAAGVEVDVCGGGFAGGGGGEEEGEEEGGCDLTEGFHFELVLFMVRMKMRMEVRDESDWVQSSRSWGVVLGARRISFRTGGRGRLLVKVAMVHTTHLRLHKALRLGSEKTD